MVYLRCACNIFNYGSEADGCTTQSLTKGTLLGAFFFGSGLYPREVVVHLLHVLYDNYNTVL